MGNKATPSKTKFERFIVRLSANEQSQLKRNYLLVHYLWHQNEPTLPERLFRRSKLWKMKLVRIPECDRTVAKMIQTFNEKGEPFPADLSGSVEIKIVLSMVYCNKAGNGVGEVESQPLGIRVPFTEAGATVTAQANKTLRLPAR